MKTGNIERKLDVIRGFEYDDSKNGMRPRPPWSPVQTIWKQSMNIETR